MTLAEQVGALRRTLYRVLNRRLHTGTGTECSFQQLVALKAISREGVRTQAALAERMLMDPPAVSRMVDRLEEDRLLKREAGDDRRSVRLEITAAGVKKVALLDEQMEVLDRELRSHLTREEATVTMRALAKLQEALTREPPQKG